MSFLFSLWFHPVVTEFLKRPPKDVLVQSAGPWGQDVPTPGFTLWNLGEDPGSWGCQRVAGDSTHCWWLKPVPWQSLAVAWRNWERPLTVSKHRGFQLCDLSKLNPAANSLNERGSGFFHRALDKQSAQPPLDFNTMMLWVEHTVMPCQTPNPYNRQMENGYAFKPLCGHLLHSDKKTMSRLMRSKI